MSTGSHIEWTDATWNPVSGCTRVSAGCDHCYAVRQSYRLEKMGQRKYAGLTVLNARDERHFNGQVRSSDASLTIPLGWKKPRRIFVNSMSDLFHRDVPFEFIDKVFAVMALCPQHTFQILTKRPERMAEYLNWRAGEHPLDADRIYAVWSSMTEFASPQLDVDARRMLMKEFRGNHWPLPNVWLGTSVEDQPNADERIPHLLKCLAAVRFLSAEPLLGEVNLQRIKCVGIGFVDALDGRGHDGSPIGGQVFKDDSADGSIDWVIVGGESGHGARPFDLAWANSIRRQCESAGVACFIKQLGSLPQNSDPSLHTGGIRHRKGSDWNEWPDELRVRQFPVQTGGVQ